MIGLIFCLSGMQRWYLLVRIESLYFSCLSIPLCAPEQKLLKSHKSLERCFDTGFSNGCSPIANPSSSLFWEKERKVEPSMMSTRGSFLLLSFSARRQAHSLPTGEPFIAGHLFPRTHDLCSVIRSNGMFCVQTGSRFFVPITEDTFLFSCCTSNRCQQEFSFETKSLFLAKSPWTQHKSFHFNLKLNGKNLNVNTKNDFWRSNIVSFFACFPVYFELPCIYGEL